MFKKAIIGIAVVGVVVSLSLGAVQIIPWQVSGVLVPTFIGIPSLVLAYLSLKEKKSTEEKKQNNKLLPESHAPSTRLVPQQQVILEETCVIDTGEYTSYDLELTKGEEVTGEISSDERISFYFLNRYGLSKFENNEGFSYEYGSEGILKAKIRFTPPRTGTWYLVIENEEEARATVTVHLST